MNIKVLYNSRTGNTTKVAEAIANACNVKAEKISEKTDLSNIDLLFIGDGIYFGSTSKDMQAFISRLDKNMVKNIAVFGTYGGQLSGIDKMKSYIKSKGINVLDETYGCKGKAWIFINKSHPNTEELNNANKFAKSIIKKLEIKN